MEHSSVVKSAVLIESKNCGEGSNVLQRLIDKKMLNSTSTTNPKLIITFKQPVYIESIKLFNRTGIYGRRSKSIALEAYLDQEKVVSFYNLEHSVNIQELKEEIEPIIKSHVLPKNPLYAAKFIRKLLLDYENKGHYVSDKLKYSLLPIKDASPTLDEFSASYISDFIEKKLEKSQHFDIKNLTQFCGVLNTDASIEALSVFASKRISDRLGFQKKVVISKHTVHYDTLNSQKDALIKFMSDLFSDIQNFPGNLMLGYGTLLGAYRDSSFLDADDDIDLIYFIDGEENKENRFKALILELRNKGYLVNVRYPYPHITVKTKLLGIGVDIFAAWGNPTTNQTSVVMEKLKYRDIDTSILIPTTELSLYGVKFPAPASVEAFLEERYGTGWYRKNPYYSWTWPLKNNVFSDSDTYNRNYDYREATRAKRLGISRVPQMVAWSQCVDKTYKPRPPQNSIPMIHQALEYNYDVVELDIRSTLDGEIILTHDDLLKIHGGDSIKVSKSRWEDLKSITLSIYEGVEYKCTHITDALALLKGKRILLDGRLGAKDYKNLRKFIKEAGVSEADLLFCVYNDDQLRELTMHFPDSVLLWKFYTQAWEIDPIILDQLRISGCDGVLYMYPRFDEELIRNAIFEIKCRGLQSLAFVHGRDGVFPHTSGLSPSGTVRTKDNYEASLKFMASLGIEYVTTTECNSQAFKAITRYK